MSYVASWSGGKDSCFAYYEAVRQGYSISHLANFISKEFGRVSFHGTEAKLIQLQSQAIGIPLLQKETTWEEYEEDFKDAVRSLIPEGVNGMVFGDICLDEHKDWVEKVCRDLGIKAIEPLWGRNTEHILSSFINEGFEAFIINAKSKLIDEDWIGRQVDNSFVEYLKRKNVEVCGENGEYHTLVTNGPIFKRRIRLIDSRTIARDGYWFLDTVNYQLSR